MDAAVANEIFKYTFEARRDAGLSAIMALNQLQFLPRFDIIIFLKDGEVVAQGSFPHLLETCPEFATLVDDVVRGNATAGDIDTAIGIQAEGKRGEERLDNSEEKLNKINENRKESDGFNVAADKTSDLIVSESDSRKGAVDTMRLLQPYFAAMYPVYFPVALIMALVTCEFVSSISPYFPLSLFDHSLIPSSHLPSFAYQQQIRLPLWRCRSLARGMGN